MLGYNVHSEDTIGGGGPLGAQINKDLPDNAARLHNIIHVANHIMSHILHFYHLVALDYVKPVAWNVVPGAFTPLTRPFLAPRYDDNYYINTARILAVVGTGLIPPAVYNPGPPPSGVLTTLPGWGVDPGSAVNNYLVGQYLRALNIRRICHELQAIFSGRAPQCSGYTPGGATCTFKHTDIVKAKALLYAGSSGTGTLTPFNPAPGTIAEFVGEPTDFAIGKAGTMMFDVVAAAHLFPEYFWIGNAYSNFMAWGWGEEAGAIPLSGLLGTIWPNMPNPAGDNRASARGWKTSAAMGAQWHAVDINRIGESIGGSRYLQNPDGTYPGGALKFKHPWSGVTSPDPNADDPLHPNVKYSWLKSPRYDTNGLGNYLAFEVGPLSRMVVAGTYFAGVLNFAGYPIAPVCPPLGPATPGPDCAGATNALGAALRPVYALIPGVQGGPNLSGVAYNGDSVLDRIAARAIETRLMVDMAARFLNQLDGGYDSGGWSPTGATSPKVPIVKAVKKGYGMTEASRGALSHWIKMKNGKITLYQAVVPTTWNANPRDANGLAGPAEQSLMSGGGTWIANPAEPIELPRITHSYDFCIACAVHLITPEGEVTKVDIPAMP